VLQRRSHANEAPKCWDFDPEIYKPEIARTTLLKARALDALGESQEAAVAMRDALPRRKELLPEEDKAALSLKPRDFDALVTFWSRRMQRTLSANSQGL
jgi:hypothetical protein